MLVKFRRYNFPKKKTDIHSRENVYCKIFSLTHFSQLVNCKYPYTHYYYSDISIYSRGTICVYLVGISSKIIIIATYIFQPT